MRATTYVLSLFVALTLCAPPQTAAQAQSKGDTVVDIPDDSLFSAIALELGTSSSVIFVPDMLELTQLRCVGCQIANLEGLQFAPNLVELHLAANNVRDLTVLSGLRNLTTIDFRGNLIQSLGPLAPMTQLLEVDLKDNIFSNIDALSALSNVVVLELGLNSITEIAPLADLRTLEHLGLRENDIDDVSALIGLDNLRFLDLQENMIEDIGPLVENFGFGDGDTIDLTMNPLNFEALGIKIPLLQERQVTVLFDYLTGAVIFVTPDVIDFGILNFGEALQKSFFIRNIGDAFVAGSGVVAPPFFDVAGGSYGLSSGEVIEFVIEFAPDTPTFSDTMMNFGGGGSVARQLTGTGSWPILNAEASTFNAPPASGETLFDVFNTGTETLFWSAEVTEGMDWLSLPGATAGVDDEDLRVAFTVNILTDIRTGMITLTAPGAESSPLALSVIQGFGGAAEISLDPLTHNFGEVSVRDTAQTIFTVRNEGGQVLEGSAATAPPFRIAQNEDYVILPGMFAEVVVTYTPTFASIANGTVTFSGGGGAEATLRGTGVTEVASISTTPSIVDFGFLRTGDSRRRTIRVENTGETVIDGMASAVNPLAIVSGAEYLLNPGERTEIIVEFAPEVSEELAGMVMFSGGSGADLPATGVSVDALGTLSGSVADADSLEPLTCAAVEILGADGVPRVVTTDALGDFHADDLPGGNYMLVASSPDFDPGEEVVDILDMEETEVMFFLNERVPGGTIAGTVSDMDSDTPLAAARVEAFQGDESLAVTHSCAEGQYELQFSQLKGMLTVDVVFSADDYVAEVVNDVDVVSGEVTELNEGLNKSAFPGTLLGVVRDDETDEVVPFAQVTAKRSATTERTTDTTETGEYIIINLAEGAYDVHVSADGYISEDESVTVFAGDIEELDVDLVLGDDPGGNGGSCGALWNNGSRGGFPWGDLIIFAVLPILLASRTRRAH